MHAWIEAKAYGIYTHACVSHQTEYLRSNRAKRSCLTTLPRNTRGALHVTTSRAIHGIILQCCPALNISREEQQKRDFSFGRRFFNLSNFCTLYRVGGGLSLRNRTWAPIAPVSPRSPRCPAGPAGPAGPGGPCVCMRPWLFDQILKPFNWLLDVQGANWWGR